jgi:Raf kinase inhibitor-like YbhB/YbcL family protein
MLKSLPKLIIFFGLIISLCACSSASRDEISPTNTTIPIDTSLPDDTTTPVYTPTSEPPTITPTPQSFNLGSSSFTSGAKIPKKHARKGDDLSPPLKWGEPPPGTESFALIVYSSPLLDGGGNWVQWILYNIPAETRSLPEGLVPDDEGYLPDGSRHHKNSWWELKYGGMNPQHTFTFSYYFYLYALDTTLDLNEVEKMMDEEGTLPWIGASKAVLERAIEGHVLGQGELVGKYKEE